MAKPRVFISHISEESGLAEILKKYLLKDFINMIDVFVSSDMSSIPAGNKWLDDVNKALQEAKIELVLCSVESVGRPWINFEAGAAWLRGIPIVPVCHSGLRPDDLPMPLKALESITANQTTGLKKLYSLIAKELDSKMPKASYKLAVKEIEKFEKINEERIKTAAQSGGRDEKVKGVAPPKTDKPGILIDLSHHQNKWPNKADKGSIFDLASDKGRDLRAKLAKLGETTWEIGLIEANQQIRAEDLKKWRGLILGIPSHKWIKEKSRKEIVNWVRKDGGRVLLLGFELGDRHHKTNLNDLAKEFGLRFNADIVAPKDGMPNRRKPYDQPIDFEDIKSDHPLLKGVNKLRLENICTITFDPGADVILPLSDKSIYSVTRETARYRFDDYEGELWSAYYEYDSFSVPWMPIMAEAPEDLTGEGKVVALGTWDMFGRKHQFIDGFDNLRLLRNILEWLGERA